MSQWFASIFMLLALAAVRAEANEYVCELSYQPPNTGPTLGTYGHLEFYTSDAPNCGGAIEQHYLCSKGATYKFCGVDAQYSEASLLAVYTAMRSAEVEQHSVVPTWDACINAGGSCVGSVLLYPAF
jgi:hypothetical protein